MNRPTGMLMTGAIGSIFMSIAWLIMIGSVAYIFSMVMGGGAGMGMGTSQGLGALMLLAGLLLLAGGICQGIGFFGLKQLFGGLHALAGVFAILISVGLLISILGGLMTAPGLVKIASYLMIFSIMLGAIVAGIAFLGARSQASGGEGALLIGGAAFLAAGVVFALLFVLGIARINIGVTLGKILAYVWVIGSVVGHIGAILVMLGQRKGGAAAPAPAAPGA